MEEASKKALDLLQQSAMFAREFIEKHGPQAWDTVLWVYTINGLHTLLWGTALTFLFMGATGYSLAHYRAYKKQPKLTVKRVDTVTEYDSAQRKMVDRKREYEKLVDNDIAATKCGFGIAVSLVSGLIAGLIMLNPWTYVWVFKPELAVARDVMSKLYR